jgi:hypothetical protein
LGPILFTTLVVIVIFLLIQVPNKSGDRSYMYICIYIYDV